MSVPEKKTPRERGQVTRKRNSQDSLGDRGIGEPSGSP
jgi:hypothetical protein